MVKVQGRNLSHQHTVEGLLFATLPLQDFVASSKAKEQEKEATIDDLKSKLGRAKEMVQNLTKRAESAEAGAVPPVGGEAPKEGAAESGESTPELEALRAKLAASEATVADYMEKLKRAKEFVMTTKAAAEAAEEESQAKLGRAKEMVQNLTKRAEAAEAEVTAAKEAATAAATTSKEGTAVEVEALRVELEKAQATAVTSTEELETLRSEMNDLKVQHEAAVTRSRGVEEEATKASSTAAVALEAAEAKCTALEAELKTAKETADEATARLTAFQVPRKCEDWSLPCYCQFNFACARACMFERPPPFCTHACMWACTQIFVIGICMRATVRGARAGRSSSRSGRSGR
jgi:DNA repair exonuclease SbcCD ATPase subunit